MARPLRIEYKGAWYHIMNRGLARNPVFLSDKHYEIFLELIDEVHNRYQAEIHAYCLMGNHYHLLIRTPLGNISRIMRHLDGVYTQRFNLSVKRDGPLFRGRFKSVLVEADVYFLRLSRYIHLNPVKAELVNKPEQYKWSSYNAYLSGNAPYWLCTDYTLNYFEKPFQAQKYKAFIEEGIDSEVTEIYNKLKIIPILGTEAFIKTVTEIYLDEKHKINDIPEHKLFLSKRSDVISLQEIIASVSGYYKVQESDLCKTVKGGGNKPRSIAMYIASTFYEYTHSQISFCFKEVSESAVSKASARLQTRIKRNTDLRREVESILEVIREMSDVRT